MVQKCIRADGKKKSLVIKVAVVIRSCYPMGAKSPWLVGQLYPSWGARENWWLPFFSLGFPHPCPELFHYNEAPPTNSPWFLAPKWSLFALSVPFLSRMDLMGTCPSSAKRSGPGQDNYLSSKGSRSLGLIYTCYDQPFLLPPLPQLASQSWKM